MGQFNIRLKLGLLILITIIPTLVLILFGIVDQYETARNNSLSNLKQVANTFSAEQSQTVEGARQLLIGLSTAPSVKSLDNVACNNFLSELILNYKRYANFGVADENGDLVCSAIQSSESINVADRPFFKRAYGEKKFAVGEYQIGQISKKSVLNFGHPITDNNGRVIGVVFSSLDLSWVNEFISASSLREGGEFSLIDQNGIILARNPDPEIWIGKVFKEDTLIKEGIEKKEITSDVAGTDGVRRLYAFKTLVAAEELPAHVVVSLPYDVIFEEANQAFKISLAILFITSGLLILVSWRMGNLFLVRQIETLQELDKQKTEFVSTASHQLRTPLSGMKMLLEILLGREVGKLNRKQTEIAKNINESNERIIGLVNALLNVSKIELGKLKMNAEPIELRLIFKDLVSVLRPKIALKKSKLVILNKENIKVFVDRKFFTQALLNLFDNAIKYSPINSPVKIEVLEKGESAAIKISDKGYGISVKEQASIFQKFYRGQNITREEIEGNGLGLYIAKNIIEESGGKISFVSQKNKGTTFTVIVPIFKA